MIECKSSSSKLYEKIVKNSSIYFSSVLMDQTPGKIWVDNVENIHLILVYSDYQQGFQFMGEAISEDKYGDFREFFDTVIVEHMKNADITAFEYGADTDELFKMVERIFIGKAIQISRQLIYKYIGNEKTKHYANHYEMVPIDRTFFESGYSNMDYIIDEITLGNWNIENYLQNGLGYAAIDGDIIIAKALVLFHFDNVDNVSVDTLKEYRKKGLSTILTKKVLDQIAARKHVPVWDCDMENTASKRVAEKCGFQLIYQEKVGCFEICE